MGYGIVGENLKELRVAVIVPSKKIPAGRETDAANDGYTMVRGECHEG